MAQLGTGGAVSLFSVHSKCAMQKFPYPLGGFGPDCVSVVPLADGRGSGKCPQRMSLWLLVHTHGHVL